MNQSIEPCLQVTGEESISTTSVPGEMLTRAHCREIASISRGGDAHAFFADGAAAPASAAAGGVAAGPPFRLPFRCAGGLGPFAAGAAATAATACCACGCDCCAWGCAAPAGSAPEGPASPVAAAGMELACSPQAAVHQDPSRRLSISHSDVALRLPVSRMTTRRQTASHR